MGTSKMTNILTLTATLMFTVLGVVSTSNAMPVNANIGKIEARGICLECEIAQRDAGLNKTQNELLHMVSLISPDGKDPRETVSQTGKGNPFAAIGKLSSAHPINVNPEGKPALIANTSGVAFLIAPCLIISNDHVVHGFNLSPKSNVDYTMIFETGDLKAEDHPRATAHAVMMSGDLSNGYKINEDWTVLKLDRDAKTGKCLGETLGWFKLPNNSSPSATAAGKYISAGYPLDRGQKFLSIQRDCSVTPGRLNGESNMRTTCATLHGNSGGPIFKISDSGAPVAVGITTYTSDQSKVVHKTMDEKSMNRAIDLNVVNSDVSALVEQEIGSTPNPLEASNLASLTR